MTQGHHGTMNTTQSSDQGPAHCGSKPKRFAIGIAPLGTVSIGIVPMGVVCIGIVPMGVVSIGVVAMGVSLLLGEAGVGFAPPPPVEAGKYAWVLSVGYSGTACCNEGGIGVDQVTPCSGDATGMREGLRGYQDPMPAQAGWQCPAAQTPQVFDAAGPGSHWMPGRGHSSVGEGKAKWRRTRLCGKLPWQCSTSLPPGGATCTAYPVKEAWSALTGWLEPGMVETAAGV